MLSEIKNYKHNWYYDSSDHTNYDNQRHSDDRTMNRVAKIDKYYNTYGL